VSALTLGAVVIGCNISTVSALKLQSAAPAWLRCLSSSAPSPPPSIKTGGKGEDREVPGPGKKLSVCHDDQVDNSKLPPTKEEILEGERREVRAKKYGAMINFLASEMRHGSKEDAILVSNRDALGKLVYRKLVSNGSHNPKWEDDKNHVMQQRLTRAYYDEHALGKLFEQLEQKVDRSTGKINVLDAFPRAIREYYNYWLKENNMRSAKATKTTEERIDELYFSWSDFSDEGVKRKAETNNKLKQYLEPTITSFVREFVAGLDMLRTEHAHDKASYELGVHPTDLDFNHPYHNYGKFQQEGNGKPDTDTHRMLIAKDLARGVFFNDAAYVNRTLHALKFYIRYDVPENASTVFVWSHLNDYSLFGRVDDRPYDYDYSVLEMKILCDQIISIQGRQSDSDLLRAISMIENLAFLRHINQSFDHMKANDTELWGEGDANENLLTTPTI